MPCSRQFPKSERPIHETISSGLRGQSGGPISDREGTVWAVQSHTRHYPFSFKPLILGRMQGQVEHQFLNANVGTRAEAILEPLAQQTITHERFC